ncbi:hypothetical protein SDRG_00060 [Saprolegnia diclina VS20]|uniref:DOMON domain-containing protein n=1 Tax=Saprolegnia diclina (strain VS20) TaxID=1156394 RepID=T0R5V6_SAPDV|nr:hypothetical protein SDRG_00060 [Saprolegnia diclina VS20]EQC42321.1 hypothetical protein SDRG_00060 [Saprolegnia diclina VS20]|eukprot:XP_008603744.1 hypothetical protein SDRG_00060 [Saprolegnia diclina VS20]
MHWTPWVVASLPVLAAAASSRADLCDSAQFQRLPLAPLGDGPARFKSLASATDVCFQVALDDAEATWLGLTVSPTAAMVNDPTNAAVIYNAQAGNVGVYTLGGYEPELLTPQSSNVAVRVHSHTRVNGSLQVTFQRPLVVAGDVRIDLDRPTILNWAYGHDAWPSYHQDRGSATVRIDTAIDSPSLCSSPAFTLLPLLPLGESPIQYKTLADDARICIHAELHDPQATWLGLAFSNSTNMVNDPFNNAVVFDGTNAPTAYALTGFDPEFMLRLADQSHLRIFAASSINGVLRLTYERSLAAVASSDVAIDVTKPDTILNWAYGHDAWPSYHQDRGSARVALSRSVVGATSLCASKWFQHGRTLQPLDPSGILQIKHLVYDGHACIQLVLSDVKATWLGLSLAPKAQMVNDPVNNAVVFDFSKPTPALFALTGYEPEDILPLAATSDASSFVLYSASVANGTAQFTFQRRLDAATATDVAIAPNADAIVNWAYGHDAWPSYHQDRGSSLLTFQSLQLTSAASPSAVSTSTLYIVLGLIVWLVFVGLVATHVFAYPLRRWLNTTFVAPPRFQRSVGLLHTWLLQPLSDLKVGEAIVLLHYVGCLGLVGAAVAASFEPSRVWSLVSGHLALVHLMLLLLPVARGVHWEVLVFGSSFERVLKFHRVLGRLFVVFAAWHLYLNAQRISVLSMTSYGSQGVVPFFGFSAFLSFALLGLFAVPYVRRNHFELFYYVHRVAAVGGLVFACLHARTVWLSLILPLTLYVGSYLWRLRSHWNRFRVVLSSHTEKTVTIVLPSTPQTKAWARDMPLGAYFWVAIPAISWLQWHPFSAMATVDASGAPTIGFVIKATTDGSFVDDVYTSLLGVETTVVVGGPYGNLSINLDEYDTVLLIAGGIGVTPLLHILNQQEKTAKSTTTTTLHWIVRTPSEFGAPADFLPKSADNLRLYADEVTEHGRVLLSDERSLSYAFGRPRIDDLLKPYAGTKTCVLVCGPPGLAAHVQAQAYVYGLDLHKETFLL